MCHNEMIQKAVNIFCNDCEYEVNRTFRNLRCDENFTDVTSATEDNQQIDAQCVILSTNNKFD